MEPEEETKKIITDDLVAFVRRRSESELPRYTAKVHKYIDAQRKQRRAAAARRHYIRRQERPNDAAKHLKSDEELKLRDQSADKTGDVKAGGRLQGHSRDRSLAPSDKCCRPRRKRSRRRRKRRKSCGRRRRRRRSRRRRRRKSCGRRRRRRRSRRRRRRRRSRRRRRRPRRTCCKRGCGS